MGAGSSALMRVRALVGSLSNLSNLLCNQHSVGFVRDIFRLYPELEKYYRRNRSQCEFDRYIPYLFPDLFQTEILQPLAENRLTDVEKRDVLIMLCKLDFSEPWEMFVRSSGGSKLIAERQEWLYDGLVASAPESDKATHDNVRQQVWLWNYLLRKGILHSKTVEKYLSDINRRRFIMNYVIHDTDPKYSTILYEPISRFLETLPNRERMDYMKTLRRKQLEKFIPMMLSRSKQLDVHVSMFIDELYTRLTPLTWAYMFTLARATRDIYRPILNMFFIPLELFRSILEQVGTAQKMTGSTSSCFKDELYEAYQDNTLLALKAQQQELEELESQQ